MFRDRTEAGAALAARVKTLLAEDERLVHPVVLALPRGGVPVGLEVAQAIGAPLDLVLVRKIGMPGHSELAAGAVVDGPSPQVVLNRDVMRASGVTEADLEPIKARELEEIERRRALYRSGRPDVPVEDHTAIVVDDGIATGATTRAALLALRARSPRALVLAVPVAPRDTIAALAADVDHLICLETPAPFYAIGAHYRDFRQLDDAEVVAALDQAPLPGKAAGTKPGR